MKLVREILKETSGRIGPLYHGTKVKFDQFDDKKFGRTDDGVVGRGFYFTARRDEAIGYAENDMFGHGSTPHLVTAYVSLRNPFFIRQGKLPDGRSIRDVHGGVAITRNGAVIRKVAEDDGCDGIIFERPDGTPGHVVAWDPSQIEIVSSVPV